MITTLRSLRAKSRNLFADQLVSRLRSKQTVLGLALALAACGGREELQPAVGGSMPPKPAAVAKAPTATELMKPEVQARPRRSDELLRQSEQRRDDRFDLPPN